MVNESDRIEWHDGWENTFILISGATILFMLFFALIRPFFLKQIYTVFVGVDFLLASSLVVMTILGFHHIKRQYHLNPFSLFTAGVLLIVLCQFFCMNFLFFSTNPALVVFTLTNFCMCFALYTWVWNAEKISLLSFIAMTSLLFAALSISGSTNTIKKETQQLSPIKQDEGSGMVYIAPNNLYGYVLPWSSF